MTKARTLADFISDGSEFADGAISVAEVSGAAPLASPAFTADASFEGGKIIINEVTGSDAYSEIRKTNGGSNFAIVSPEALYLLVDSDNNQTNRGVVIGHNSALPGSSTSLAVIGENGTVFNEPGADVDFRVESDSNTHMLFVDASLNRVGINDSGPVSALTVNGDILSNWNNSGEQKIGIAGRGSNTYSTTEKTLIITGADAAAGGQAMQGGDVIVRGGVGAGNEGLGIFAGHLYLEGGLHTNGAGTTSGAGRIYMKTAGVERLNIYNSGSIVINETGEDTDFRVESNNQAHMLFVNAGANSVGIKTSATDAALNVNSQSSSTEAIRITGSGGNPFIEMVGNQGQTAIRMWENGANDPGYTSWYNQGSPQHKIQSGANETVIFNEQGISTDFRVESVGNNHQLFVDASQNVVSLGRPSFGEAGTSPAGYSFHHAGGACYSASVQSATSTGNYLHYWVRNATNGGMLFMKYGNTTVGSITNSSTGVTFNTTSDRRLKTDIQPIANGTEKLMAMNPVTHKWKADPHTGETVHGFIAQEMQEIVPEAVSGDPDGEEMMSMDYGRITPVLVAALQDAHKKIEALEERLADLEAK